MSQSPSRIRWSPKNHPRLTAFLIGVLTVFVFATIVHLVGPDNRFELIALDWLLKHRSTLPRDPRIVHVDIDDDSLERVGRWPWPRDRIADLIRTLHDLDAKLIAVDLLFDEAQERYIDHPRLSRNMDIEPNPPVVGELDLNQAILSDLELADAIRTAGNVILAMHLATAPPKEPDPWTVRLRSEWQPGHTPTSFDAVVRFGLQDTPEMRRELDREILRLRLRDLLFADFTLAADELASRLSLPESTVEGVIAGVKSEAARILVQRLFEGEQTPSFEAVLRGVLGDQSDRRNADREDVFQAYRHSLGLRAIQGKLKKTEAGVASWAQRAYDVQPPYYPLVEASSAVGAVVFHADPDGIVRRIPPLIEYEGRLVLHQGLATACQLLNLDESHVEVSAGRGVRLFDAAGKPWCEIPLDDSGQMFIHWTREAENWRRDRDFPHISAAKLWSIVDAQRSIAKNETAYEIQCAEIVSLVKGGMDQVYRENVSRHNELKAAVHRTTLEGRGDTPESQAMAAEASQLREKIQREHTRAAADVKMVCQQLRQDLTPDALKTDAQAQSFLTAERVVLHELPSYTLANETLRNSIEETKAELRPRIADKCVFLGFAATASGDIVSTPIDPLTNGVMCHAHLLNTILHRQFIVQAPRWAHFIALLALGIIVSALTSTRGPTLTLLATLGIVLAYIMVNVLVLFGGYGVWLTIVSILLGLFLTWAIVTLLRQLTAERERRIFAKQLSQYTSPAIAARIAENPAAAHAFKSVQSREVTCLFTDLQGFTTISEEIDAETVQTVLNTYLERMSRVIWDQQGLINKFIGDGIMAVFNASVSPQEDHANLACTAAVRSLEELERLKVEHEGHAIADVFRRLKMRAGISTGICKNGDFGSELKADYTVIGDVVNLAARLEPANKVFGTHIMVAEATRQAIADRYEFRYMANLQVKGKLRTVPVYELICAKGLLAEDQREYVARFETGIRLYKEGKWDECIVHFTRLLARRPDDLGASRYIDACQELKAFPPDGSWNGALELKEK